MRALTAAIAAALVLLPAAPAWAANTAPTAAPDAVSYRNAGIYTYAIPALANDSDPDGDALTYSAVSTPGMGTAYLQNGQLFYKPSAGNQGTDSFTYTVTDGQGNAATGTVTATLWVDPAAPTDVTITSAGAGSVTLSWAAAPRAVQYRIIRNGAQIARSNSLTWTDPGPLGDQQYEYQVFGVNGGGWAGALSASVWRRSRLAPTGLTVDLTEDPTQLSVAWDDAGVPGPWNVYRDGALLTTSPTPHLVDTGLVTGRQYSYQVQRVAPSSSTEVDLPSLLSAAVPGTPAVLTTIGRFFLAIGGSAGQMGPVTYPEGPIPGGRQQHHTRGIIIQKDGEPPLTVRSDLATRYLNAGGAAGELGFPLSEQKCRPLDNRCRQSFEGGSIGGLASGPTWIVRPAIVRGWAAAGWEESQLGFPTADQVTLPGGGVRQAFEDGAVYFTGATGSHGVSGPIFDFFTAGGSQGGRLGYPTADMACGLRGGGCGQRFQGGYVSWSPATGARAVTGVVLATWGRQGGQSGALGYPTAAGTCGLRGGGCGQRFQGGYISWSPATGARIVSGAILTTWGHHGGQSGALGYPTAAGTCGLRGGGCGQRFQGGYISWSPATGAQAVTGAILTTWGRQGGQNGRLGYPTTEGGVSHGLVWQSFQGGSVFVDVISGRVSVSYR